MRRGEPLRFKLTNLKLGVQAVQIVGRVALLGLSVRDGKERRQLSIGQIRNFGEKIQKRSLVGSRNTPREGKRQMRTE